MPETSLARTARTRKSLRHGARRAAALLAIVAFWPSGALAAEWFVARGSSGTGTSNSPFGTIQAAIDVARPGDTVIVRAGTYLESLRTVRDGVSDRPIRIRTEGARGAVTVMAPGRVLTVSHPWITIEGFVFDGQYGNADAVRINTAASHLLFRDNEVRRSSRDLIDISGPSGVVIEECLIHHALNAANGRTDAHGIAAGPVDKLTVRNTEIHTFSGDAFQVDPGRSSPGWRDVLLDGVRIWLAPLPSPENGFAAGVVPGENGVDTKASAELPRATMTIRNTTAWGFRHGLIRNLAAFNLKEHVAVTLDGITVYDSEIAFRLRGARASSAGAWVTVTNAVVYDVTTAYRYEDDIQNLRVWNSTLGADVERAFDAARSSREGLDVRNLLVLGPRPAEATDVSNLAATEQWFVDVARHDYRLAPRSPAIDAGAPLSAVLHDRNGVPRPVGRVHDVGAYEWQPPP